MYQFLDDFNQHCNSVSITLQTRTLSSKSRKSQLITSRSRIKIQDIIISRQFFSFLACRKSSVFLTGVNIFLDFFFETVPFSPFSLPRAYFIRPKQHIFADSVSFETFFDMFKPFLKEWLSIIISTIGVPILQRA